MWGGGKEDMSSEIKLNDLTGLHKLSGVDFGQAPEYKPSYSDDIPSTIDFIIDGEIYSAIENPSDGYRSSMGNFIKNRENIGIKNKFQENEVYGIMRNDGFYRGNDVIDFYDVKTNKIVLSVETGNCNDYYPYFVSDFNPENMCLNIDKRSRHE